MPATPISAANRYINPETTSIYWVPTIADKTAPTRSELNAGTELVSDVSASEGWQITSEQVPTPDMGSLFTSSIPGRTSVGESSLTMYADLDGDDARTLMARNTNGFIVWMDGGDTAGRPMDIYPVRVSSVGKVRSVEGGEAATLTIMYSITSEPAEDVAIPA
jgi:hypothetical protein